MSFIVKGMDLPTKDTAPLNFTIWSDGTVYCRNVNDIITKVEVVQIAKDHGNVIDRDELIEHLKKDPLFSLVENYGITGVIKSRPVILEEEEES